MVVTARVRAILSIDTWLVDGLYSQAGTLR